MGQRHWEKKQAKSKIVLWPKPRKDLFHVWAKCQPSHVHCNWMNKNTKS
jgi:hypothetical protein